MFSYILSLHLAVCKLYAINTKSVHIYSNVLWNFLPQFLKKKCSIAFIKDKISTQQAYKLIKIFNFGRYLEKNF